MDREIAQVFLDLRGQLARRCDDQGARGAARLADETVQDREQERGGLAAPGLGAAEDVAALDGRRERFGLDWRGTGETELFDTAEEARDAA